MAYSSKPTLPSLDSLNAAIVAARLGSFSAAALELNTTHAAISRRIAVAEAWAGLSLFDRHARGVVVTLGGQRVIARLQHALELIAHLGADPSIRRSAIPRVRLAATPSFARFWLLPRLKVLEGIPADVRVEVIADLKHADLARGEVDLAIRYGRGGWQIGDEERLFTERLVPIVKRGYPSNRSITLADLHAMPLLHSGDTTNWRAWAATHARSFKSKLADRTFADYSLAIEAACVGLGAALWNPAVHSMTEGCIALNEFATTSTLHHYLLSRKGDRHSPVTRVARRIRVLSGLDGKATGSAKLATTVNS